MQSPGTQTFYRGTDRILGGVCSGLGEGFHVEVLWVRLAFVVLAFINGLGLLLYVVLWVLMPERAGYRPPGQNVFESMGADIKRAWADLKTQFGAAPAGGSATPTGSTGSSISTPGQTQAAVPAPSPGLNRSRAALRSSSARSSSCSVSLSWLQTAASRGTS